MGLKEKVQSLFLALSIAAAGCGNGNGESNVRLPSPPAGPPSNYHKVLSATPISDHAYHFERTNSQGSYVAGGFALTPAGNLRPEIDGNYHAVTKFTLSHNHLLPPPFNTLPTGTAMNLDDHEYILIVDRQTQEVDVHHLEQILFDIQTSPTSTASQEYFDYQANPTATANIMESHFYWRNLATAQLTIVNLTKNSMLPDNISSNGRTHTFSGSPSPAISPSGTRFPAFKFFLVQGDVSRSGLQVDQDYFGTINVAATASPSHRKLDGHFGDGVHLDFDPHFELAKQELARSMQSHPQKYKPEITSVTNTGMAEIGCHLTTSTGLFSFMSRLEIQGSSVDYEIGLPLIDEQVTRDGSRMGFMDPTQNYIALVKKTAHGGHQIEIYQQR